MSTTAPSSLYKHLVFTRKKGLFASVHSGSIIKLNDDLDATVYLFDENSARQETVDNLHIFIHKFIHKDTKNCIAVISFQPTALEFLIDSIQVTCDVAPPFHDINGIVNIADLAYVAAIKGQAIWALYRTKEDGCIQRRFTDKDWTPLDDIEELHLNKEQCFQVIISREHHSTEGVTPDKAGPNIAIPFPELGSAKGEILRLDDNGLDDYDSDDNTPDKEGMGTFTKIISTRARHPTTKKCVDVVHIDMDNTEDFLDTVQLSCEDSNFVKGKGLIAYRGLIYLCDQAQVGHPIWVVYALKDSCELRTYTDNNHQIIEKKSRKLSWDMCKRVINTQEIGWLPQESEKTASKPAPPSSGSQKTSPSAFITVLSYLESLIAAQVAWVTSKFPSLSKPTPPQTPLAPQPIKRKETAPVLTSQPLTGSVPPPLPPPPPTPAVPQTTTAPSSPPAVTGGFMSNFGLFNNALPPMVAAPSPPPPPPPAPVPPKKSWFNWG